MIFCFQFPGGNVEDLQNIDGVDQWEALKKDFTIQRDHILLNIDEATHTEGIILHNRWKLIKGGIFNYAPYDFHWGKESNIKPPPIYDPQAIAESQSGRSIISILGYENTLDSDTILEMRKDATINCDPPVHSNQSFGEIPGSYKFFCPNYCLFDIIKDPCELNVIKVDEVINLGLEKLSSYRKKIVPQTNGPVDPKSNPEFFGGVWMPWMKSGSSRLKIDFILKGILCVVIIFSSIQYK